MAYRYSDSHNWKARLSCLAFLLLVLIPTLARAQGALTVSPVRVDLSKARRAAVLTLRNDGNAPTVVQAQVMAWSQQDGVGQYTETGDILVSPPLFTITAGATQIVRLGLRRTPDPTQELAYRLFLQQVPSAVPAAQQTVRMALRINLPVFVEAIEPKPPQLTWSAHRDPSGEFRLSVDNSGLTHVLLFDFEVGAADAEPIPVSVQGPQYVLAGQKRSWLIKVGDGTVQDAQRLRIRAKSDAGDVDTEIALASP